MSGRFDDEIKALRAEPPTAGYDQIDREVWRCVDEARRARQAAPLVFAVRAVAIVGALGLGVASGAAAAMAVVRETPEISAFSIHSGLAPSTLLDRHG